MTGKRPQPRGTGSHPATRGRAHFVWLTKLRAEGGFLFQPSKKPVGTRDPGRFRFGLVGRATVASAAVIALGLRPGTAWRAVQGPVIAGGALGLAVDLIYEQSLAPLIGAGLVDGLGGDVIEELDDEGIEKRVGALFVVAKPHRGGDSIKKPVQECFREARDIVGEVITRGIKKGEFRKVNPRVMATVILGILEGVTTLWVIDPEDTPVVEVGKLIEDLIRTYLVKK